MDGHDGGNLRHAITAFEMMRGLPVGGKIGPTGRRAACLALASLSQPGL
ncbi:hypothetical protein [Mesorhizobium loti]